MAATNESPGSRIRALWERLSPMPGGRWLFSALLGRMVPYSGSIGARVETLEPGHVVVTLRERRAVRNHLRSVHAIAIANLGELATGLALLGAMGTDVRGILLGIEVRYTKKARGLLTADVRCEIPAVAESIDHVVDADIHDEGGDTVATIRAHWRLSPVPSR